MTPIPGTNFGPYEIQSPLGAGGMGEVYRARDTRLDREVAIKVLPSHLNQNPKLRARFEREAKTISGLQHPNICVLYDVGRQDGVDYLKGETLSARIKKGPVPLDETLKIAIAIAGALAAAHSKGIIHRDLKPGNVMRWAFKATVFKSSRCKGFVGYGDADPSNVSPLVHGAEMRVAETRAVNRALRKAYGIGICSVEEIGSFAEPVPSSRDSKRIPPQPVNGKNGNYGGPKVRDRLCQLIRQHQLDANLVKSYAVNFCGTKTLREATREQVEAFVAHLADWAEKDRNALLCQLNSYPVNKEGAA